MSLKCGIVGLPNVGKSTLFNALLGVMQAEMANYPFCTIDPNVGIVPVEDDRLIKLATINKSKKTIPATLTFVDIAGLVKGASKGEGMGNQFLSHIREVDAIVHVLRCFKNEDIQHVHESVDPIRDKEIIETELLLSDLQILEKTLTNLKKKSPKDEKIPLIEKAIKEINAGHAPSEQIPHINLLSNKPVLYVCNVGENNAAIGNEISNLITNQFSPTEIISATIEYEIAKMTSLEDKAIFLDSINLTHSGLTRITKKMYEILGLITYFTSGEKETRAWTITSSTLAPAAAGVIHSDFEKKFIRAETISYNHYVENNGTSNAREKGLVRFEGKHYQVQDGDIIHFHHS